MENNLDIQVGDKVTYKINGNTIIEIIINCAACDYLIENRNKIEIIKIERPKYEMVEEKKELLTEEEKTILKDMIENVNKFSCVKVEEIYTYLYDKNSFLTIRFYNKDFVVGEICTKFEFKKIKECNKYTLKELGLEE